MKTLADCAFRASITLLFILLFALFQTWDGYDRYMKQPPQPPAHEPTPAEVSRYNDLGGHDADSDIQWTYQGDRHALKK